MQTHASIDVDCKRVLLWRVLSANLNQFSPRLTVEGGPKVYLLRWSLYLSSPYSTRYFATPYTHLSSWSGMGPVLKLRLLQ